MSMSNNTDALADTSASASAFAVVKKELNMYPCSSREHVDYLDPSDPQMIPARDNVMLVDWCYYIVDRYRYSREAVALAMEMVVRFLSLSSPCNSNSTDTRCYYTRPRVFNEALSLRDPSKLQLLIVTALYVSIKINEKVAISSDLFSEMCRHIYSAEEIEEAERMLLSGLLFQYHPSTAHQADSSILSLHLPCVEVIPEVTGGLPMDEMKYSTELALSDYCFSSSKERASTIDLAADSLAKQSGTFVPVESAHSSISMDDSLKTSKASNRSSDSDTDELTASACSEITCIPERGHGQEDQTSCTSSNVLARFIKNLRSKHKEDKDIGKSAVVDPNQNSAFVVDTSSGTADFVTIKISKQSSERGPLPSPSPADGRREPRSRKGSSSGSARNRNEEIQSKSNSNPRRRSTIDVPPRSRRSSAPKIQPRSHMKRRSTIDDGHRVHPKKGSSFNIEDSSRGPMKKSTSTPSFHRDFHPSSLPRRDRCRSSTSKFDYRPVLVHSREDECPPGHQTQTIDHDRRKRTSSRSRRKGKEDEKSRSSSSRKSKSQVPVPGPPPSRPPELGRGSWSKSASP